MSARLPLRRFLSTTPHRPAATAAATTPAAPTAPTAPTPAEAAKQKARDFVRGQSKQRNAHDNHDPGVWRLDDPAIAYNPGGMTLHSLEEFMPATINTYLGKMSAMKAAEEKAALLKKPQYIWMEQRSRKLEDGGWEGWRDLVGGKYVEGEGLVGIMKRDRSWLGKEKKAVEVLAVRAPQMMGEKAPAQPQGKKAPQQQKKA